MKPAHTRWLLALGLAGTLALVWLVPDDENDVSTSAARTKQTRKNTVNRVKEQKSAKSADVSAEVLASRNTLNSSTRPLEMAEATDLFKGFSWYVPPPPPPPPPPEPPPKPTAPPLPFVFFGQYAEGNQRLVLLSRGDRLLSVKIGEVIENTYKIESLTGGQLRIVYLPLAEIQTLSTGVIQ